MSSEQPKRRVRLRPVLFEVGGVVAFTIFVFGAIEFFDNLAHPSSSGSAWSHASGTGLMCWLIVALLFFAVAELCSIADRMMK